MATLNPLTCASTSDTTLSLNMSAVSASLPYTLSYAAVYSRSPFRSCRTVMVELAALIVAQVCSSAGWALTRTITRMLSLAEAEGEVDGLAAEKAAASERGDGICSGLTVVGEGGAESSDSDGRLGEAGTDCELDGVSGAKLARRDSPVRFATGELLSDKRRGLATMVMFSLLAA